MSIRWYHTLIIALALGVLALTLGSLRSGQPRRIEATHLMPCGDLDDDGIVNGADASILASYFPQGVPPAPAAADMDGNTVINAFDLVILGGMGGTVTGCQDTPVVCKTTCTTAKGAGDADLDGCLDVAENGAVPAIGGMRGFLDHWDFFDVWTRPPGMPMAWERNGVITLVGDILGVAARFGPGIAMPEAEAMVAASTPPAPAASTGYHAAYDRGAQTGANLWNRAPPDGVIGIPDDILGVAAQFGHTCA